MTEYIERDRALNEFDSFYSRHGGSMTYLRAAIAGTTAADVRPVVRGKWVEDESGVICCSERGEEHEWIEFRANFCDNCGADMRPAQQLPERPEKEDA